MGRPPSAKPLRASARATASIEASSDREFTGRYSSGYLESASSLREQPKVDGVGHRFVTRVAWMQMIAAVRGRCELRGFLRIARSGVKIDHAVERAAGANP